MPKMTKVNKRIKMLLIQGILGIFYYDYLIYI
jgi:hypothetical protein